MFGPRALLAAALGLALRAAIGAEPLGAPENPTRQAAYPAHTPEEALAALRPVLIGKRELDQARRRLAVQLARMSRDLDDPGPWREDNTLVVRGFIADVQVAYALEFPEGTRLVSRGMMKAWGIDPERLHQRALANLDARQGELQAKPVGKLPWLHVLDAEDGLAASRVLLHWRWRELAATFGGALVLGMPTRDVVVFTATREPEKLEQLRETVETVERHQGRPVSRRLFHWTIEGWRELEGPLQEPKEQGGEQRQD